MFASVVSSPNICSCCYICLNARNAFIILSIWPPPPRGEGSATLSKSHSSGRPRSRKHQCHGRLPPWAGNHTRLAALHREMLIHHSNYNSAVSNPLLSGEAPLRPPFTADGNKANKEICSIFQNIFSSVKFFSPARKDNILGCVPTP